MGAGDSRSSAEGKRIEGIPKDQGNQNGLILGEAARVSALQTRFAEPADGQGRVSAASGSRGRQSRRMSIGQKSILDRQANLGRALLQEALSTPGAVSPEWQDRLRQVDGLIAMSSVKESKQDSVRSSVQCRYMLEGISNGEGSMAMGKSSTMNKEVRSWLKGMYTEEEGLRAGPLPSREEGGESGRSRQPSLVEPPRFLSNADLMQHFSSVQKFDLDVASLCLQPEVSNRPIQILFGYVLHQQGLLSNLPEGIVDENVTIEAFEGKLSSFITAAEESYLPVVFHNNRHGADVMMVMHWFFASEYMLQKMSAFDHLISLITAAVHDVGHDGVTNMFHCKTRSSLALRYNDRSCLENMHCATTFEIMNESQNDFFAMLNRNFQLDESEKAVNLQGYFRKSVIDMVLSTDTQFHDQLMADLADLTTSVSADKVANSLSCDTSQGYNCSSTLQNPAQSKDRQTLLKVLMHAADVSNPTRPERIMKFWVRRVLMEFWDQGDEERRLGVEISPLCDRAAGLTTVPNGQIGFANFIVKPLYVQVTQILPEVQEAVNHMQENVAFWQQHKQAGSHFDEIFKDVSQEDVAGGTKKGRRNADDSDGESSGFSD
eukprot:TRINITY_DN9576_c0_g1_i2.p1 TRINITY_DN9576_c0_g1~~TRINITY_DN9576_c0_g1_i2.p1  ORF type:complete len:604 (-),score=108.49 TRINITY_DN9576_c0_g1_i2:35-1846(-)